MRIPLELLAEDLSRLVIANEVQPGSGYSTAIWELAICVREELKAMRATAGGLPPLKFHYTMRDALWELPHD